MSKLRVLFIAEAATLAHIARPLQLSTTLPRDQFDIFFACDSRCKWLIKGHALQHIPISSISSEQFLTSLARGTPLYSADTLESYTTKDLALFEAVKPDLVVGDFRLSLSVSARLAKIPYATITNGYWSPYWTPSRYSVPNLPLLTGWLPIPVADALFQATRPIAFALHCRPLNRIRKNHGLPPLGSDLRRIYTDADFVLYTDLPQFFPAINLPSNHHFIGPLVWSPPAPRPDWWNTLPPGRTIVYVTLGSSGQATLLPRILDSLKNHNITVIAAAAGNGMPGTIPANARVANYLPGDQAAKRASLVICNGGSPTCQQALAAGVPIIGISSNLDQFLNMDAIVNAGIGENMRADRFHSETFAALVTKVLEQPSYTSAAQQVASTIENKQGFRTFSSIVSDMLR